MLHILAALLLMMSAAYAQPIPSSSSTSNGLALNGPNVAGRAFYPMTNAAPANIALGAANRLYADPIFVGSGSTLKTLSFNIGTGNASAWNARMCVYADNGSGAPGNLIPNGDTGTIAIASGSVTGTQTATLNGSTGIPVSGWIWVAFMADSNAESLISLAGFINTTGAMVSGLLGSSTPSAALSGTGASGVFVAQTFGSCPSSFGAVSYSNGVASPFLVGGF